MPDDLEARRPDPQRRSEKSRRSVLDAALDLCEEQGYGPVTVEAIAARAGVSKKTIYRWWPSKGAVVLEALDDAAAPAADFPDTGDLRADLLAQMEGLLRELLGAPRFGRALVGVIADTQHDAELARALKEVLFRPRAEDGRARLTKGREAGQIGPDADVDLALELLYGPVYYRLLLHQGDLHSSAELQVLVDHTLRALAPPAAE
ncbi:TetR/AcrR family transcriptional regulator [Nocardiopsis potens]|uniref:TetR/AcrR family transcriptional regulator n=1 Tax=Nocardiopsis potens TaxID=1246458 RepID=UPI0009D99E1D|nr:TetR/AcrR family transcriptional regulator [Nocardiopsis potens]